MRRGIGSNAYVLRNLGPTGEQRGGTERGPRGNEGRGEGGSIWMRLSIEDQKLGCGLIQLRASTGVRYAGAT